MGGFAFVIAMTIALGIAAVMCLVLVPFAPLMGGVSALAFGALIWLMWWLFLKYG